MIRISDITNPIHGMFAPWTWICAAFGRIGTLAEELTLQVAVVCKAVRRGKAKTRGSKLSARELAREYRHSCRHNPARMKSSSSAVQQLHEPRHSYSVDAAD
jgi:hypothetical protein